MSKILKLQQYLSQRPIGPIFAKLKEHEKNDEIALKFMCVVDHQATKINLYARINSTNFPKLLHELLGFQSYKSFTYFDYISSYFLRDKFLQCKFSQCQFIGPYMLALTHMVVNHNMNVGSVTCAYCNDKELKEHFFIENSMNQCYQQYLLTNEIPDVVLNNSAVHLIVVDFYEMLKECSKKLEVPKTARGSNSDTPSTSRKPTPSDINHNMNRNTPQPDGFDPFIQLLSDRYERIKNKRARRKLEHALLNEIGKVEEEEESEQNN